MRRACQFVVLALLLGGPAPGYAQSDPVKELAQKRYKVGEQLYDISKYDQALEEFEKAYKLYPLPAMLYNIARCHEVLANLPRAIETYKLFIQKVPDSPHAPLVKTRIASLEERLAAKKKAEQDKATREKAEKEKAEKAAPPPPPPLEKVETQPAPAFAPAGEEPPAASKHTWRWPAGWACVGVGGGAVLGSLVVAFMSMSKNAEYDAEVDRSGIYEDIIDLQNEVNALGGASIGLFAGGIALSVAGAVMLIVEAKRPAYETNELNATIAPVLMKGGAGLSGQLRF